MIFVTQKVSLFFFTELDLSFFINPTLNIEFRFGFYFPIAFFAFLNLMLQLI